MKKLLVCFIVFFLTGAGICADITETRRAQWEQDQKTFDALELYHLYWSDGTGGPYYEVAVIPKPQQPVSDNTYEHSPIEITVSGPAGTIVRKYFVLRAVMPDNTRTVWSNEAIVDFEIPDDTPPPFEPQAPTNFLIIKITIIPDPPPSVSAETALIMLHGLNGSSSNWNQLKSWLVNKGYDRDLMFAPSMTNNTSMCSANHLTQIKELVAEIKTETEAEKFVLIGHSRGGTASMNFMWFADDTSMISDVVTLAGANNYNCTSTYGAPPTDKTAGTALYTSIWSPQDGLVSKTWSIIDGANNVELANVGHLAFISNQGVFNEILKALQGGGQNN